MLVPEFLLYLHQSLHFLSEFTSEIRIKSSENVTEAFTLLLLHDLEHILHCFFPHVLGFGFTELHPLPKRSKYPRRYLSIFLSAILEIWLVAPVFLSLPLYLSALKVSNTSFTFLFWVWVIHFPSYYFMVKYLLFLLVLGRHRIFNIAICKVFNIFLRILFRELCFIWYYLQFFRNRLIIFPNSLA